MSTNTASGLYRRQLSRRFIVPTALTSKSSNGRRAARSWLGCAAQWMTRSNGPSSRKVRASAARSRMSTSYERKRLVVRRRRSRFQRVLPSGPKKSARMSLSIPTTAPARGSKWRTSSEPMSPLDPVMSTFMRAKCSEGPKLAQREGGVRGDGDVGCRMTDAGCRMPRCSRGVGIRHQASGIRH